MNTTTEKKPRGRAAAREAMPDPLAPTPTPAQAELHVAPAPANDAARKDLASIEGELVKFDHIEAGIVALETKHKGVVFDCTEPAQLALAESAIKEIQTPRFNLEHARTAAKAPVLLLGKTIDAKASAIKARLLAIETPIVEQVTKWKNAEEDRLAAIRQRIKEVRETPAKAIGRDLKTLEGMLEACNTLDLTTFQELRPEAAKAQLDTQRQLGLLISQAREAEEERTKAAVQRAKDQALQGIRDNINAIKANVATAALARSSGMLDRLLGSVLAHPIDDSYGELRAEAELVHVETVRELQRLLADKVKAEADAKSKAETDAENKRLRDELAALRAATAPAPEAQAPAPDPEAPAQKHVVYTGSYYRPAAEPAMAMHSQEVKVVVTANNPAEQPIANVVGAVLTNMANAEQPAGAGFETTGFDEMATPLGLMPEPPTAFDMVSVLATELNDHPINIITTLEAADWAELRAHFTQPTTEG